MSTQRDYKRSWKNLLINKRYQLSFTLLMVGLATLLMIGLGVYVMHVASETTTVSKNLVRGRPCPKVPAIEPPYEETAPPSMKLPDGAADDDDDDDPARPRRRIEVTLDEMQLPKPRVIVPPVPANFGRAVLDHWLCELSIARDAEDLEIGQRRILFAMIGFGLLLVVGLAAYGIKMTHRVAGPLFKVQLYFSKMRDGKFDRVYNLRKGDQLVDFYDHFKHAHAGIVAAEQTDITELKAAIAAAEAAGAGDHDATRALREILARKEKSVG